MYCREPRALKVERKKSRVLDPNTVRNRKSPKIKNTIVIHETCASGNKGDGTPKRNENAKRRNVMMCVRTDVK